MLVVAATALFGTIGTARVLGPTASSWSVGALRLLLAVAVLLAVARWLDGRGRLWALVRRPESFLAGAGQAAFQLTFLTAVELTGVAVTTLVAIGSAPLLTGVLTRAVTARWVAATALGLVGLGMLVGGSVGPLSHVGLLLALGAGLAYAVYTTASSRLARNSPSASVTAAGFVVAAALLGPALLVTDNGWVMTRAGATSLGYLAVVATALAYLLFVTGLRAVPAATAQTLGLTEPVVATALGVLVLGESLRPVSYLGASLVIAGLVVLAREPGTGNPTVSPRWRSRRLRSSS
ncbi:MAG: EamA family transporter [Sporichthyaceae bacterium]|nr:EamA family transporter [Sporichthyaceae bacterium]